MNEYIRFKGGRTLKDSYIVRMTEEEIAVYVKPGMSFRELYELFGDPQKTARIRSNQYGEETTWAGFTELCSIDQREYASVVRLRKG